MIPADLADLLEVLRAHGVRRYAAGDLLIVLGDPPPLPPPEPPAHPDAAEIARRFPDLQTAPMPTRGQFVPPFPKRRIV